VLQRYVLPPPPPVEQQEELAAKEEPEAQAEKAEKPADEATKPLAKEPVKADVAAPAETAPRKRIALGSFDPASGYSGVYTFDSRGAALELAELNGKYRAVDDPQWSNAAYTGYLGYLALENAK